MSLKAQNACKVMEMVGDDWTWLKLAGMAKMAEIG